MVVGVFMHGLIYIKGLIQRLGSYYMNEIGFPQQGADSWQKSTFVRLCVIRWAKDLPARGSQS